MNNEWISVKDRLPGISTCVLTYWNTGAMLTMLYCGDNGKSWFDKKGT